MGGDSGTCGGSPAEDGLVRVRDVTDEATLRERLAQANKLISLGPLVAGVAHEINNPNNYIMVNAPILAEVWRSVAPILDAYEGDHGDFSVAGIPFGEIKPEIPDLISGIDGNAFADSLFGHLKGAFTGASDRRRSLVEQAFKGTLHLDEIGDLIPESQIKLLRLLQEKEYFPLGSDTPKSADIHVVVTTNRGLIEHQESVRFRRDHYYRLCTHQIHIPPLRARLDDLPLLLNHFLKLASKAFGKESPACPETVIHALARRRLRRPRSR